MQSWQGSKWAAAWRTVATLACTVGTNDAFKATYEPAKKGSYRMETTMPQTDTHTAATTAWQTFTVK